MDAITAGVGINLISASIQKIGSVTFQKFVKVNKVEQMIRNGAAHDPVLVEALDHFRKALLRGESSYTQDVEAFISELMKTTLLSELMDECLIGVPSESLKYAFSAICAETCGADRADELFLALVNTFRATVRVLLKDDALHVYLRAISTEIQKLRSKIALKLVPSNSQATSKQNFQKKIQNLAKHLVPSFKSIRIETNRGARIVDLSRLYLEPHLSLRRPNPAGVRMLEISRRHSVDDLGDESLLALTYKEVANSARRIVVLGDPGGGKSTLCQYLCYKVAKAAASTQSRSVRQNGRLPIRVIIRSFERAKGADPQLSLLDFMCRDISDKAGEPIEVVTPVIHYAVSTGRALVVFDGLDEILDPSRRREFIDDVLNFTNRYPLSTIVVTSREVGYEEAPLTRDFEELTIARFGTKQIGEYLIKYFVNVFQVDADEASRMANRFVEQVRAHAYDLAQNPLMLGLMAWLFHVQGDVPANRPEIYKECSLLMFEKWDQNRGIKAEIPADFDLLNLFSHLAMLVYG